MAKQHEIKEPSKQHVTLAEAAHTTADAINRYGDRLMGIQDDLKRLADGEALGSVFGVFEVGDRIVISDAIWDELQDNSLRGIEHIPRDDAGIPLREARFGTVLAAVPIVVDGKTIDHIAVRHDDGKRRRWDARCFVSFEDWLAMTIRDAPTTIACQQCGDTGWKSGDPNDGMCHCQREVNYKRSDSDFAARRRRRRDDD